MKLNLDFSLYKGTTRLRVWWKAVKANFEAVQNAHNDLEDTHAKDKKTLTDAVAAERRARETADNNLGQRITDEATARQNADTALGVRITNETNARTDADTSLGQRIDREAVARESADSMLDGRIDNEITARAEGDKALSDRINDETAAREELDAQFKPVAEKAHTHENKDVLDGITAERVNAWDIIADGTVTLGEYLEHLAEAERQFDMLWDLLGMTVYDGGWFGTAQLDVPLDGGSFDDTALTPLDCGDFGKFVPSGGGIGDVVDGGIY